MDFLNEITSVEYADRQSPGCAWHHDPACLCDVDRAKFVVGDGPYNIPPDLVRRWCDALEDNEGDGWFASAHQQMWWDTLMRKGMQRKGWEIVNYIEDHADDVKALVAGDTTIADLRRRRNGLTGFIAADLARLLGLAPGSPGPKGTLHSPLVRDEAVRLYDEGVSVRDIHKSLQERGVEIKYHTIYGWVRRFAQTWTGKRPSDYPSKAKVAA